MEKILLYITKEKYHTLCDNLKDGETRNIYCQDGTEIDILKIDKKIYNFISNYGEKKFSTCIEDAYLRKS